jgi:ATP/maltotriose-dependent transcriptional regulator MalT
MDSETGAATGELLESLAADLGATHGRLALFIDDLHCLHHPDAVRMIEWLINYAPRHVQFVLGGRELSRVRLSGLRLRGWLYELDQRQLSFDMEEAGRFYGARLGHALDTAALAQLMEKTEGWPAGLQLAALALQDEPHHEHLIDDFTGTDRGVVEYLGDVLLGRLDDETRRFLYVAAQFDRVSGALAAVASGLADAPQRLARLHERGLFLIPLDRRGEWFRFHHLAGEFFRRRVPPGLPADSDLAAQALMRSAAWLHGQGLMEEAINCAVRARQWQRACGWLAEHIEETSHSRGAHRVVLRWMREIPQEWVDRYPLIRVHYAFSLAFSQRRDEAERELSRLERLLSNPDYRPEGDAASIDDVRCGVELQRVMLLALGDQGQACRDAARNWLARWPGAAPVQRGSAQNVQAFGHKCCGELGAGIAMAAVARQTLAGGGNYYGLTWSFAVEALLHLKQGNYVAARGCCDDGLRILSEQLGCGGPHRSLFHVTRAAVAYEFDDIPRALEEMERGLINLDEAAPADWLILGYLTQARLLMHAGNEQAAIAALHEGQATARARGLTRAEITLAAEECVWLCRGGQAGPAQAIAQRHGFERIAPDAPHCVASDKALRIGARLAIPREPARVAQALLPAIADSRQRGLSHREVELLLLRALALHRARAPRDMLDTLVAAARLGQSQGYRRVFLDDAHLLHPLLGHGGPEELTWLRELQSLGATPKPAHKSGAELTKRELHILARLDSGLSNREIAESLFISEGTLKWHLHNVYDKLAVRNRSGAIVKAKRLGLLRGT